MNEPTCRALPERSPPVTLATGEEGPGLGARTEENAWSPTSLVSFEQSARHGNDFGNFGANTLKIGSPKPHQLVALVLG